MNTQTISRNDLMLFLQSQSMTNYKNNRFHTLLASMFNSVDGVISLGETQGASELNISERYFRTLKKNALQDGYWLATQGHAATASTYVASAKLVSAVVASKEQWDS